MSNDMATKGRLFAGCTVALATPFRDGQVDYDALKRLVEWQIARGTAVLSPCGTTGESPTLSHEEHEKVIAVVVETTAGRAKVLAGTGSNATSEAISLTKFAQRVGADGTLQVTPYYNRPTQEGMYAHFARIAEVCDLPMMLYNIPSRCGRNLEPETVARLAELPQVVAIKEASGSLDQVSELVRFTNLTVVSGDDSLTLPMLAVGGEGVVSVVANLAPQRVQAMIDAFQQGQLAEARAIHQELFTLSRNLLGLSVNPVPVKAALEELGLCSSEVRLPLTGLTPPQRDQLRKALAEARIQA